MMNQNSNFLEESKLIQYSEKEYFTHLYTNVSNIKINQKDNTIKWLNTYGIGYSSDFKEIIIQNNLDDFLIKLFSDKEHSNKVIELDNALFIATKILKQQEKTFVEEQLFFVLSSDFLWSIQENRGVHFEAIRERIRTGKGAVRSKKADYLFFLILESLIDNYEDTFQKSSQLNDELFEGGQLKPTPEFTNLVEIQKQELIKIKKATLSLRNTIVRLEKPIETEGIKTKYFSELKEQANNLIADIDFEFQDLDSKINLIFSIQGYRLNEVMKTLTIFSVIFIPLTFLAGIYGMNFENIPELKVKNGYFILLGVMAFTTLLIIWYFKRKKWF